MRIAIGATRIVIVFCGFAIKFARFRFVGLFYKIKFLLQIKMLWRHLRKFKYMPGGMIHEYLLLGILSNLNESKFYRKTKLDILMPTYFSFFGLFNIQRAGKILKMKNDDVFWQIQRITMDKKLLHLDAHTFSNAENFAKMDEHIKVLDYGNVGCQPLLEKYGVKIYQNFDFSFDWEEVKKGPEYS